MDTCTPAFVTAALFISILILDLGKRNYRLLGGHFLLGVISVLLMLYLCQHDADYVAWGLLLMPFLLLAIGFIIGAIQKGSGEPRLAPVPSPGKQEDCTCDENAPYASVCVQHPIDASGCIVKPEAKPITQVEQKPPVTTDKTTQQTCGPTTGIPCVNPAVLQSA